MFGTATSAMAAAVTKAGGFGIIGGGFDVAPGSSQLKTFDAEFGKAAAALGVTEGQTLPVGMGFITFHPSFKHILETLPPILEKYRVAAVWLAFPEKVTHAEAIRGLKETGKDWGLKVFVQVGNVEVAREAARQGADIIVAQGIDAGGHQWAQGAGVISLVPEVRDMLDAEFKGQDIALIAAGGIVDGRGVAAALALGAEGVVMGTRFIATREAPTPDLMKNSLLATSDGGINTIKSTAHDDLQGTGFWPTKYDGRAIIGDAYNELQSGATMESLVEKFKAAGTAGDHSRRVIFW